MAPHTVLSTLAAAAALLLLAGGASAQSLYRSVGPDGRISYSDRAPAVASGNASAQRQLEPATAVPVAALPYELREVSSRYPVTLYTAADCAPCASARTLLSSRGVPFTERTVASNEDIAALKALSGDASLPFGTVGSQQLRGFSDTEWQRNLDAAGYPKSSQLPANWRAAAATPLVQRVPAQATVPAAAAASRPDTAAVRSGSAGDGASNSNNNPAGIRF